MWYRSFNALIVILSVASQSHSVQPTADTIQTNLGPMEYISASWVSDEREVVLAIAHEEVGTTRVIYVDRKHVRREYQLPNFSANHLQMISSALDKEEELSFFLCGGSLTSTGPEYVCRVYSQRDGELHSVWDSNEIEVSFSSSEAVVDVSTDGKFWGVMEPQTDDLVRINVGILPERYPQLSVDLSASWPTPPPPDVNLDATGFVFVDTHSKLPLVALIWNGLVYVVGPGEPGIKATLATIPAWAGNLYWQSPGRLLWLDTYEGYRAYTLPPNLVDIHERIKLAEKFRVEPISGAVERFRPTSNGDLVLIGGPRDQGTKVRRMKLNGPAWVIESDISLESGYNTVISDSGKTLLLFPNGEESQHVEILRH